MRIEKEITIEAPLERVWEWIGHPQDYPRWLAGITRFEPEDERPEEPEPDERDEVHVGSRYAMRMHVGSADVGGLIEVVECDPAKELAWTSITGIDQRGRWRLRETGEPGQTKVTMRMSYGSPGGITGALVDRLSAPEVGRNISRGLKQLKAEIEEEPIDEGASLAEQGKGIVGSVAHELGSLRVLVEAGVIRPVRPDKLVKAAITLARWGRSPAAGFITGAVIHPNDTAVVDDLGTLSWREIDERTNALAHSLADAGIKEGDGVAIMCRNHRGFIEATVAIAKLGGHALYLNTAFAGPQLTEVVKREKPIAIVFDEEFSELLSDAAERRKRFIGWHDSDDLDDPTLDELIEQGPTEAPVPPNETGKAIILTSGTTGTPKGANRSSPDSMDPAVSLLSKIPMRNGETSHIAAPLFHSWGFAHFTIGMLLGTTVVITRKFDPEDCLAQIERYRADHLVVVPVMMKRILELPESTRRKYDTSSLKIVAASGSALPGDLAAEWMDEFGDTLYNLYGSTEVAWATIATPADMRAAPGTAGKPPRGTVLKFYDENGLELPAGKTGRIFVGNEMLFEGYTGGGSKDFIDGLMATDDAGRLFVEGRDDEMIVSGGENLFPKEVEDILARHPDVADVAAIGVDDEKFGQRLRAFVVTDGSKKGDEDALKKHVKSNLAGFKVPREIWFLDELPRNATGKVLKRELKEIEKEPK
ncbi:MAG TPA: AMP-binding protein [Thermoleophilaceae bacterium]|nr:AMP-binding protein [Thermoleophilaceae bacterium]